MAELDKELFKWMLINGYTLGKHKIMRFLKEDNYGVQKGKRKEEKIKTKE